MSLAYSYFPLFHCQNSCVTKCDHMIWSNMSEVYLNIFFFFFFFFGFIGFFFLPFLPTPPLSQSSFPNFFFPIFIPTFVTCMTKFSTIGDIYLQRSMLWLSFLHCLKSFWVAWSVWSDLVFIQLSNDRFGVNAWLMISPFWDPSRSYLCQVFFIETSDELLRSHQFLQINLSHAFTAANIWFRECIPR